MDIRQVLEPISRYGFWLIEVCTYPDHLPCSDESRVREVAGMMRDLGIEPVSLHAPFGHEIDISSFNEEQRNYSIDQIIRSLDAACILGVPSIVLHPGPEKERLLTDADHLQQIKQAAYSLLYIHKQCKERGLQLVIENMLGHLSFGQISDFTWLMDDLLDESAGFCFDTGHANLTDYMYTFIDKFCNRLRVIHTHDNFGHGDDHLPPGQGMINWNYFLHRILEGNCDGTFVIELSGHDPDIDRVLTRARNAYMYLGDIARDVLSMEEPFGKTIP